MMIFKTDRHDLAATIARMMLGILIFPHGMQKLPGWFGGYGFRGTMDFFTQVKHIPYFVGLVVIAAESVGAVGLVLGLGTRLWALLIIADMIGIILSSHLPYGFFINWFGNQQGEGYEYHLMAIGLAMVVLFAGGGRFALDNWLSSSFASNKKFGMK